MYDKKRYIKNNNNEKKLISITAYCVHAFFPIHTYASAIPSKKTHAVSSKYIGLSVSF